MMRFTSESMYEILNLLQNELKTKDNIQIEVLNPIVSKELYNGETIKIDDTTYIYRSLKTWSDLAESLYCKFYTLKTNDKTMILEFEKLNKKESFHNQELKVANDKYGIESTFFRINKNEEPTFLNTYINALKNVKIETRKNILNLGINKADEFEVIANMLSTEQLNQMNFYGIDFSSSAIEYSKNRFTNDNFNFYCHDINKLEELNLPKADTIISIGTLQSTSLNFKTLFMNIVQNYLDQNGSMILGFPNCRWIDSEVIYGAKVKNYTFSEQSVLYNDVIFCKKYLQQKKFRVTLTGKNYLFLTATSIR